MSGLVELHMYKCQFVRSFVSLGKHRGIKSLNLRGCFITDDDLPSSLCFPLALLIHAALADMPVLVRLNISDCAKLTDAGMRAFFVRSKTSPLKWVKLADCRRLVEYTYNDWMQTVRNEKGEITNWIPLSEEEDDGPK